jgi:hypothetical protein
MSTGDKKPPSTAREMDRWFNDLVSGTLGKVAFLSLVPLSVYVANVVSSHTAKNEERFRLIQEDIRSLGANSRDLQYQQSELMRHIRVIEYKVLGYSSLPNEQLSEREGFIDRPYRPPITTPVIPEGPPPVPPPRDRKDGDRGAMIDPTRRRLGAVAPTS